MHLSPGMFPSVGPRACLSACPSTRLSARLTACLYVWLLVFGFSGFVGFVGVVAAGSAEAAPLAHSVRVLIYDQPAPVQVGLVGAPSEVRLDGRGGLLVDEWPVAGPWRPARTSVPAIWKVGKQTYRGDIKVIASEGRIQVLNRVRIEDYVASILGSEMSPSWPAEALRAQAVASRTYALYHAGRRRTDSWDVQATVESQVYRGISAEAPETRAAAEATSGEVLTYNDAPILAVFHSTAGGRTATAGEVWGENHPYLRSVEVEEEDDAPHTYWRTSFDADDFEAILAADGAPSTIEEWVALYVDRPSRQLKVAVRDRTVVKPQWDERRLVEPIALQESVDAAVSACGEGARGFVRPSGTEDVVRVYAEASTQEKADELALSLAKAIYENAGGVGRLQTSI